jgi:hypothetical protein
MDDPLKFQLAAFTLIIFSILANSCTSTPKVIEDITVMDSESITFHYLLDRQTFEGNYSLIQYNLYQRMYKVDSLNRMKEILFQNTTFIDNTGRRISIDQYIDLFVEPPPGELESVFHVPLDLEDYFKLNIKLDKLELFSSICCSEATKTTCQLIATHGVIVIYIDVLTVPSIKQVELMEIIAEPILEMDRKLKD